MTGPPNAAILRRASAMATRDARAAWKEAQDHPDEEHTRDAFRLCVLAARMTRKAVNALPNGSAARRMFENAKKIEAAADELKARLARIVVDG